MPYKKYVRAILDMGIKYMSAMRVYDQKWSQNIFTWKAKSTDGIIEDKDGLWLCHMYSQSIQSQVFNWLHSSAIYGCLEACDDYTNMCGAYIMFFYVHDSFQHNLMLMYTQS